MLIAHKFFKRAPSTHSGLLSAEFPPQPPSCPASKLWPQASSVSSPVAPHDTTSSFIAHGAEHVWQNDPISRAVPRLSWSPPPLEHLAIHTFTLSSLGLCLVSITGTSSYGSSGSLPMLSEGTWIHSLISLTSSSLLAHRCRCPHSSRVVAGQESPSASGRRWP